MTGVRICGAGYFVPDRVVTNERIVLAIPGWTAEKISQKTGIEERRFLWDFDETTGKAIVPSEQTSPRTNTDMCEIALRRALDSAGIAAGDLDAILLVTVSPDELNFCHDAILLHSRLGCRPETKALQIDSGCGGALYLMDVARQLIRGGECRTIAVVASNFTSAYVDREVFTSTSMVGGKALGAALTMYMFGDGAGAVVLRGEASSGSGIIASYAAAEYGELVLRRGGGALNPPHEGRSTPAMHAYVVNGVRVAQIFPLYMQRCLDELRKRSPDHSPEIARYYLHQANRRLVEKFVADAGLPSDRVAMHMHRYGNLSAAGTLVLFAEDLEQGVVCLGSGEAVLFAAIGAGVHCAGHVVIL